MLSTVNYHVTLWLVLVVLGYLPSASTSSAPQSLRVAADANKILTRLDQLAPVVSEPVATADGDFDIDDEEDSDVTRESVMEESSELSQDVTSSPDDSDDMNDAKRSPPSGKRIIFTPWGGKRAFNPWGGKRAFNPWGGKRAFNPWGGKRAFNPWGGKRAFNPWGGKRGFNPWGGKRAFNPWGGKRKFNSDKPLHKKGFNPWGGK